MIPSSDALLLDTCAIINLSYCSPIATMFRDRYKGRGGWAEAVRIELTRQRTRKPPHPQSGRACNWATSWLGEPFRVIDRQGQAAVVEIQESIAMGSDDDSLDHLGEAVSIYLLSLAGGGRLISDDHGARDVARSRSVRAASTVGVLAELLSRGMVSRDDAGTYLDVLRAQNRMRVPLTTVDLLGRSLASWA
ncbi:hypothetical protein AB0J74_28180 [Asanoa sp. NPDC049573]|uniref:hypothetical protein n=1 Tax=Asanoa sp. NPDC049573 TaxID=3155396 RepID=UPI00343A7CFB